MFRRMMSIVEVNDFHIDMSDGWCFPFTDELHVQIGILIDPY